MKKRAPLLFSIIVSMLVSAEGHSERERERDEFNLSNSNNNNNNNKRCLFVVVLVVVGIIHGTFRGGETKTKAVFGNSEEKRGARG